MKIVTPQQMSDLESQAYRDGSSETDFMDEAGSGVALVAHDLAEFEELDHQIILLCGKGNNAGDAYIAGMHLLHLDYDVTAYQMFPINDCSQLCRESHFQFFNDGGRVFECPSLDEITFPSSGIILDGLFGTGFQGKIEEPLATVIQRANQAQIPIIAIDIPSGLNGETGETDGAAIVAHTTAFLGLPKLGFFLKNGWNHVGKLVYVDFGLPKQYVDAADTDLMMLSPDLLKPLMPPIVRNRHKYQAGHVVGLAGSPAYPGAAILSSLGALCGGAGIVHLLHPDTMKNELTFGPYELIKVPYGQDEVDKILDLMNESQANFIGPGIGLAPTTSKLLRKVIPKLKKPHVIDADALTLISEGEFPIPENTILTPHLGELKRLLHITSAELSLDFLHQCQKYATDKKITLILKGGPSFIFHPGEPIMVNPRGDPGMATAGTGDVLTGLIAALLAQGLTPHHAACLGVYIHAVAGEWAATSLTSYCMTATDIIGYFPDAFQPKNWTR